MPKSKKPAGGRPAKNFEPRYGEKKTSFHDRARTGSAAKPGSKSPSHRGYRAAEESRDQDGAQQALFRFDIMRRDPKRCRGGFRQFPDSRIVGSHVG